MGIHTELSFYQMISTIYRAFYNCLLTFRRTNYWLTAPFSSKNIPENVTHLGCCLLLIIYAMSYSLENKYQKNLITQPSDDFFFFLFAGEWHSTFYWSSYSITKRCDTQGLSCDITINLVEVYIGKVIAFTRCNPWKWVITWWHLR